MTNTTSEPCRPLATCVARCRGVRRIVHWLKLLLREQAPDEQFSHCPAWLTLTRKLEFNQHHQKGIYPMNRIFSYRISEQEEGLTIGQFLKNKGYSHPMLVHLKKTERGIVLNGEWSYVYIKLKKGDVLDISLMETESSENIPLTSITLDEFMKMVVYEDEDILVLNKPAGLPVHPSMGHHEDTLANYCAYYFHERQKVNSGFIFRCVNRLDRDTSGLVLIAKNTVPF